MRRILIFPLLATSLFAQAGGSFVSVVKTIPLSAWQLGPGSSIVQLPDGTSALQLAYGSSASVDLGVTPWQLQSDPNHPGDHNYAVDGIYQFTVTVENGLDVYTGRWDLEVSYGTQQLCEWYGWGISGMHQVTYTCLSPKYLIESQALPLGGPAQGQNDFVISGSNPGWQLWFKNFSLTFTPTN